MNNVVIRNLPEGQNESISNKVSALVREGLKLKDLSFSNCERKRSYNDRPGLVVVTCRSSEDKKLIMDAKSKLRDSRQYRNVYISHDKNKEQRTSENNLRTIVRNIPGAADVLDVRGSRVVVKGQNRSNQNRAPTSHRSNDSMNKNKKE